MCISAHAVQGHCMSMHCLWSVLWWTFPPINSGSFRAQIALPTSLSSDERSKWHQLCRTLGMYSSSKGLGENRRLFISLNPSMATGEDGKWTQKDHSITMQASETHELLCEAHGGHSPYSLSELEEMLVECVDLPPDIIKLKAIKCSVAPRGTLMMVKSMSYF